MGFFDKVANIASGGLIGGVSSLVQGDYGSAVTGGLLPDRLDDKANELINRDTIANAMINPVNNLPDSRFKRALNTAMINPLGNINGELGNRINNILVNPMANYDSKYEKYNKPLSNALIGGSFGTIGTLTTGNPLLGGAIGASAVAQYNGAQGTDLMRAAAIGAAVSGLTSYASSAIGSFNGQPITMADAVKNGATYSDLTAMGFTDAQLVLGGATNPGVISNTMSGGSPNALSNAVGAGVTGAVKGGTVGAIQGQDVTDAALIGAASGAASAGTGTITGSNAMANAAGQLTGYYTANALANTAPQPPQTAYTPVAYNPNSLNAMLLAQNEDREYYNRIINPLAYYTGVYNG
jgi:hypothetical protein